MNYRELALYIDGKFVHSGGSHTQEVINPASGQALGCLPLATHQDLDRALAAAQRAFALWSNTSPLERSSVLRRVAELARERAPEIGRDITLDQGKPLAEAVAEVRAGAEHAEWHAEEARRTYGRVIPSRDPAVRQLVVREAVGVCVAFTPWNFPFNQAMRKVAAAVGAGCTLILKGPEDAPSAVVALAQLFHDAGLPSGVLNIVWGEPAEISTRLIAAPAVRKVSFTGSVPVGKRLAAQAGAQMKRTTMELGGHAPAIVFNDADIDQAAASLARSKVRNAGQTCISPTRVYVQDQAYDRFLARFTEVIASTNVGPGLEPGTQMGPLIHARRRDTVCALLEDAQRRGGRLLTGGVRGAEPGFFMTPAVVTDLPDDARLLQEEPFGPVAIICRFRSEEEALERANALPFGLGAYVFTESLKTAHRTSVGLQVGMVSINHFGLSLAETPFGGIKDSGLGSEGGTETYDGYLQTKLVTYR